MRVRSSGAIGRTAGPGTTEIPGGNTLDTQKLLKLTLFACAVSTVGLTLAPGTLQAALVVPGTANPFLAGMLAGSTCCGGDSAPNQSPIYAGAVTGGTTLTFVGVTGGVNYGGGVPTDGPNGNAGLLVNTLAYEGVNTINHIAGFTNAPVDSLVGVFLNGSLPTSNAAPAVLDFSSPTLTPQLQQIFFIGDGSLGSIAVPAGATRLYLGTVDGVQWNNNSGAINVTVNGLVATSTAPEPATLALVGMGIASLVGVSRKCAAQRS
jgi:hypothetical protein